MPNRFFLGVDGGQSSTTAVIGDENGRVVGWASGGPCNHVSAGEAQAKFLRVIGECVREAAGRAGLEPDAETGRWNFAAACLGMSGGAEDKARLLAEIIASPELLVTHDAAVALAGALEGAAGIVVIAGTGSMAFGRNEVGETARAGGWGYLFGDEGGAFHIVREAVRATLRDHEGWGARTALTPALLAATDTQDANQMLHLFYKPEWPRSRVAQLAPVVDRMAEEGDPVALEILRGAARNLAALVEWVREQLWANGNAVRVSSTGGVFESRLLREKFGQLVACAEPKHGAAVGALLIAWHAAGVVPAVTGVNVSRSQIKSGAFSDS